MRAAILGGLIVVAASCGAADAETRAPEQSGSPRLAILAEEPLVVQGEGFRPRERVKLLIAGGRSAGSISAVRASRAGRFTARVPVKTEPSDARVVQAIGAQGSRATVDITVPTVTLAPRP